jgi:hypothetical protein
VSVCHGTQSLAAAAASLWSASGISLLRNLLRRVMCVSCSEGLYCGQHLGLTGSIHLLLTLWVALGGRRLSWHLVVSTRSKLDALALPKRCKDHDHSYSIVTSTSSPLTLYGGKKRQREKQPY